MEKATIIIQQGKNCSFARLQFENGVTMPVSGWEKPDLALSGRECEAERLNGPVVRIVLDGKVVFEQKAQIATSTPPRPSGGHNSNQRDNDRGSGQGQPKNQPPSTDYVGAPYNFIPLNKIVVPGEELLDFARYQPDRYTGYLDCTLKTLTPLYIRDTLNKDELERKLESNKNPNFFGPGGRLRIPGSSLRGMVRNLVEITSWSKFQNYDDRKILFYRGLADTSSLQAEYKKNMSFEITKGEKPRYNFKAGYIHKSGIKYYIIPASVIDGKTCNPVMKDPKKTLPEFSYYEQDNGYLVVSGNMFNKKHNWLINMPDYEATLIELREEDIENYQSDVNRYTAKIKDERGQSIPDGQRYDGDLFRMLRVSGEKNLVPCFYVQWIDSQGQKSVSFGHTGYFRLAYKKTIGEHITQHPKVECDIAEMIFGKVGEFATRVFFEDALLEEEKGDECLEETSPKILSGPKPTTFQHYLDPDDSDAKIPRHWNDSTLIRGYKMYWHRKNPNWREKQIVRDTQHTIIKPVKEETKFTFRIRFENLTTIELGALLFALQLREGCCHKLGMGKPLGLGSVEITTKLIISNREERYQSLFSDESWVLAEEVQDTSSFKKEFEKYILEKIQEERQGAKDLWETPRLQELRAMLDWKNVKQEKWLDRTRYMELKHSVNQNEFKARRVLPQPTKIVQ